MICINQLLTVNHDFLALHLLTVAPIVQIHYRLSWFTFCYFPFCLTISRFNLSIFRSLFRFSYPFPCCLPPTIAHPSYSFYFLKCSKNSLLKFSFSSSSNLFCTRSKRTAPNLILLLPPVMLMFGHLYTIKGILAALHLCENFAAPFVSLSRSLARRC